MDDALLKIKNDALRLLSFRPRSVQELRSRLRLKKYPADLIDRAIGDFRDKGLLDDEKFAKLYVNSRVISRPLGKRRLELELKKKGVPEGLVRQTLEGLKDYDEVGTARELVRNRFYKMKDVSDAKKKSRLFSFLKRRGFSNTAIFSALDGLFHGIDDDGQFT